MPSTSMTRDKPPPALSKKYVAVFVSILKCGRPSYVSSSIETFAQEQSVPTTVAANKSRFIMLSDVFSDAFVQPDVETRHILHERFLDKVWPSVAVYISEF